MRECRPPVRLSYTMGFRRQHDRGITQTGADGGWTPIGPAGREETGRYNDEPRARHTHT